MKYAKIELEIAGKRCIGFIDLKHIPVAAIVKFYGNQQHTDNTPKTIAVDFDGTLFTDKYPDIGEPINNVIEYVKAKKSAGNKIILWTCRCGKYLTAAVDACKSVGLTFDAVNSNLHTNIEKYGNDCRKVNADIYIDDKAINFTASMVPAQAPAEPCGLCFDITNKSKTVLYVDHMINGVKPKYCPNCGRKLEGL